MKKLVSHIICVSFLLGAYAQSGDIQSVQYYFDTDPGVGQVGNGGIINLASPTTDLDQSFNWTIPPELGTGFHYLYVRGKSSDNTWSLHEDALFYVFDPDVFGPNDDPADIAGMEYYLDDDPGVGNGIAIALNTTPTSGLSESVTIALPPDIPFGFHYLYVRAKSSDNTWSLHEDALFYVFDPDVFGPNDDPADIASMEYYLDEDPGVGNGTAIALNSTPTSGLSESVTLALPSDIPFGFHYLYVRAKSSANTWSLHEDALFYVFDPDIFGPDEDPADIAAMEYFLDDDPGVGNGTTIPLNTTPSSGLAESVTLALPSDIPFGFHRLYVRAKSSDNTWSLHEDALFYVMDPDLFGPQDDPAEIVELEYYYDEDPGPGEGHRISITSTSSLNTTIPIEAPCLEPGEHYLHVRARDSEGNWSLIESDTLDLQPEVTAAVISPAGPLFLCDGETLLLTVPATVELAYQWTKDGVDISNETSNTILIDSGGDYALRSTCLGESALSDAVTVILVIPDVPAITPDGPTTFCAGSDVTLSSSASVSYLWSTGATTQSITVSTSDDYSVTTTDEYGCSATSLATTVVRNPNPAVPTISADGPLTFCDGEDVLLTSSVENSYIWSNGETTQSIVATTTGSYSVTVSTVNGCSASSATTEVSVQPNTTWYADADEDGFGDAGSTTSYCTQPIGYVSNDLDCDDTSEFIFPGAEEVCGNLIDDNCDDQVDENCTTCVLENTCTDMDVVEIDFGTANARVNAIWNNPNGTTSCEVKGGRIAPSSIGTGNLVFANVNNTQVITQTDGSTVLFNIVLYNNPNVPFVIGQTYGYEVRCLCEDETAFTNWSGIIPEATFVVPAPPAVMEEGTSADKNIIRKTELSIYPNPNAGDEVIIVLKGLNTDAGMVQLEVLDMLGRHVQGESIATKGEHLNYNMLFEEKLPSGIYLVRATQEGMMLSTRLVIE